VNTAEALADDQALQTAGLSRLAGATGQLCEHVNHLR
jgi:hypothetical protein